MNNSNILGRNLKLFRERTEKTQFQIADFLGVERSAISNYEKGKREISLTHLEKLSNLYGIEIEDFFEEDPESIVINMAFAFRGNSISNEDSEGIASFHRIVKNYIEMKNIIKEHETE
jgi:transcriptional regulator with XRE-family HTH domain